MRRMLLIIAITLAAFPARADDNAIAYRLYEQGRYAEAAEIFSDPTWKGVALYRSDQYWRAAEAFLRGDDALSFFNLGNCYAQLGYYELALQAYLQAAAKNPALADARLNADIMRDLIKGRDDGAQAGLQPKAQKIDEVADEKKDEDAGSSAGEEGGEAQEQSRSAESDEAGGGAEQQGARQSQSGGAEQGAERQTDEGASGRSTQSGRAGERNAADAPSGGATGDDASADDNAVGLRARLEGEQATEQWLNLLHDDPGKFLRARIELERRRRVAAGNTPPAGGSEW